jgi:hypothetical protein
MKCKGELKNLRALIKLNKWICTAPAAPNYPTIEKLIQWLIGPSSSLSATTDRPTVTGPDSKGVWMLSYLFS